MAAPGKRLRYLPLNESKVPSEFRPSLNYAQAPGCRMRTACTCASPRRPCVRPARLVLFVIACVLALVVTPTNASSASADPESARTAGVHNTTEAYSGNYVDPGTRSASPSPVLRGFDPPEKDWLPGHRGVDLDIPVGAQVAAAGDGTVHFAGSVAGTPTVSIEHDDGIRTTYQPVFAHVRAGDSVAAGDPIGTLAPPTDGDPGLHWGARVGSKSYINPLDLLGEVFSRLKPWDG